MALSSFVRRASSIRSRRCYQNQISLLNIENSFSVGGQFLPFETSGNSPVHGFVRRAYSSIAPLSIRSLGSRRLYQTQISPLGGQFLPCVRFSTVTDDNISIPIESNNIRDSSNGFVIKEGGPHIGYITLVKESQDEIIHITVRAYQNVVDYYHFHENKNYEDAELHNYPRLDGKEDDETMVDVIPCLHLEIDICQGDMKERTLRLNVIALADHPQPHPIFIRKMSLSCINRGVDRPSQYLKEFEEFLEKRGIGPGNIKPLFNLINSQNDQNYNYLYLHF